MSPNLRDQQLDHNQRVGEGSAFMLDWDWQQQLYWLSVPDSALDIFASNVLLIETTHQDQQDFVGGSSFY